MKAQVASAKSSAEYLRSNGAAGKVQKKAKSEDKDSQEIKEYLHKLQELVPFAPKDKKVSKVDIIFSVIDYIECLRETLGLPPSPCESGDSDFSSSGDEQFPCCEMDSSNIHHQDDSCEEVPVAPQSPESSSRSTSPTAQSRQPLSVLASTEINRDANQNYATSTSVLNAVKFSAESSVYSTSSS